MDTQEKDLFLLAMQDVKPLNSSHKVTDYSQQQHQLVARKTIQQLKRKQKNTTKIALNRTVELSKIGAFETMQFAQKGVQLREMNRLKNAEFGVQAVLDLHGCTQEQALQQLHAFLAEALSYRLRYVRIIHGKGYNSDSEFPILKNLTNEVLRQCPQVIAFISAAEKDGGVGAVNLLLKA